jgi:hypothetical protein
MKQKKATGASNDRILEKRRNRNGKNYFSTSCRVLHLHRNSEVYNQSWDAFQYCTNAQSHCLICCNEQTTYLSALADRCGAYNVSASMNGRQKSDFKHITI